MGWRYGNSGRNPVLRRSERRLRGCRRARRKGPLALPDQRNYQVIADDIHGERETIRGHCGRSEYRVVWIALTTSGLPAFTSPLLVGNGSCAGKAPDGHGWFMKASWLTPRKVKILQAAQQ